MSQAFPSSLTVASLTTIMYGAIAANGYQSNKPDIDGSTFQMQAILNQIAGCASTDPPDILKQAQLLNLATNTYNDQWRYQQYSDGL